MCGVDITNASLRAQPEFSTVGPELNSWFEQQLGDRTQGVLVSHNTPVDIQYLCCEYIRTGLELPSRIKLGLDTLSVLKRFSTLAYRKAPISEWDTEGITKTGKLSMGVKHCASYALSKLDPPQSFREACGEHHDAEADTRAVATILFDQEVFPSTGLYNCVFKSKHRCLHPLKPVWDTMVNKMKEPVLKMESLPPGWVGMPGEDPDNDLSSGRSELPADIPEVKEQTFVPPRTQRGEGQPSPELRRHLGIGSSRSGTKLKAVTMMVMMFLFFFSIPTLEKIAEHTNAKAMEVVLKVRYTRKDGSRHVKVCRLLVAVAPCSIVILLACTSKLFVGNQNSGAWLL